MEEKDLARQYIKAKKRRNDLLYDIVLKFLELPRKEWRQTGTEDMAEFILQLLAEQGKDPEDITDYKADLGPYTLSVRCDTTQCPEEDPLYRAEIYHRESPENKNKGLAFKFDKSEALSLYYKVDAIYRFGGDFQSSIYELEHDLEGLEDITDTLKDDSLRN